MANQHPVALTVEAAAKGRATIRVNARRLLRIRERELTLQERAQDLDLIKTALQSPVISAGGFYIVVLGFEAALKTWKAQADKNNPKSTTVNSVASQVGAGLGTAASNALGPLAFVPIDVSNWLDNFLFPGSTVAAQVEQGAAGAAGTDPISSLLASLGTLDIAALKFALLTYIATGGNAAGTLQAAGGLFAGLRPPK